MTKFEYLSLRLLIKKPRHTITMIIGIALGVAIMVAAINIGQSAFSFFKTSVSTVLGKADLVVSNDDFFAQKTVNDSLNGLKITQTASQLVYGSRVSFNNRIVNAQIIAINPQETSKLWQVKMSKGHFKITADDIVISDSLARALNAKVGDNVKLLTGGGLIEKHLAGILIETGLGSQGGVFVDLAEFQKSQELQGKINLFYIKLKNKNLLSKTKTILSKRIGGGINVGIAPVSSVYITNMLKTVKSILLFVGLFALIIGAFLIYQTTNTTIYERLRMISLLKSFGATRGQLLKIFLLESTLVGLVSSVLGITIGQGIIFALNNVIGNFFQISADLLNASGLSSYFLPIFIGLAVGLGTSLSATVIPVLKITKLSVANSLGSQSNIKKKIERCWLFSLLIEIVIPIIKKVMPSAIISIRSVTYNFRRFYLIAVALSVSVAMLIGIVIGVSAIDYGVSAFLKNFSDKFFMIRPQASIGMGTSASIPLSKIKEIEKIKGVAMVSPNHFGTVMYKGDSIFYRFFSGRVADSFVMAKGDKSIAAKRFRSGGYVIVSESFAQKRNIKINDAINVKIGEKSHLFKVAGVIVDTRDGIAMLWQDGLRYYDINQFVEVQIWPKKNASWKNLKKRLQNYTNRQGYTLLTNSQAGAQMNAMMGGISALFVALAGIIFLIISLGVANMVLVNSFSRVRLLGVIRASGMTRRQLVRSLASESILIGLLSLPFSLVSGCVIGIFFTKYINDSMGASVKSGINWLALPIIIFAILAILYLVAAFSARRIAKISVADALRYE